MDTKESLIKEWRNARPEYEKFCSDGILVQDEYKKSNPKILILLKESYADFIDIEGPCGPDGGGKSFWRKIKIWTYVITEIWNKRKPQFENIWELKESPNNSIAYINLKKNTNRKDGDWKSDDTDIEYYTIKDKEFLVRQIELINPEIIVCGGTIDFFKILYPQIELIGKNLFSNGKRIIISHSHPGYFAKGYEKEFTELTEILSYLQR